MGFVKKKGFVIAGLIAGLIVILLAVYGSRHPLVGTWAEDVGGGNHRVIEFRRDGTGQMDSVVFVWNVNESAPRMVNIIVESGIVEWEWPNFIGFEIDGDTLRLGDYRFLRD